MHEMEILNDGYNSCVQFVVFLTNYTHVHVQLLADIVASNKAVEVALKIRALACHQVAPCPGVSHADGRDYCRPIPWVWSGGLPWYYCCTTEIPTSPIPTSNTYILKGGGAMLVSGCV